MNSHCPVFHFELGVHVSSALGVTPGLNLAWSELKLSESAELGPVARRHQRRRPDRGLRPAAHSVRWGQSTVSLPGFRFHGASFRVSLSSSSHGTPLPRKRATRGSVGEGNPPSPSPIPQLRSWGLAGEQCTGSGSGGLDALGLRPAPPPAAGLQGPGQAQPSPAHPSAKRGLGLGYDL